jgi:ATP-dependent Clp protease ATP-binding subunit ClpA
MRSQEQRCCPMTDSENEGMTVTENFVRIDGWVTPRLEKILRRAVNVATERGYNYLGVEHLALAIAEDPDSLAATVWDEPLTIDGWHAAITANLPALPAESSTQFEPLTVAVARNDPNYDQTGTPA